MRCFHNGNRNLIGESSYRFGALDTDELWDFDRSREKDREDEQLELLFLGDLDRFVPDIVISVSDIIKDCQSTSGKELDVASQPSGSDFHQW